jgi:integrase
MTLAVRQGRLTSRPSFPEIGVQNARVGFFEPTEFEAVVRELSAPIKRIAVVGYYTGWRKSEILGLTWAQVDYTHGMMRLEPTSTSARLRQQRPQLPIVYLANDGRSTPEAEAALPPDVPIVRESFTTEKIKEVVNRMVNGKGLSNPGSTGSSWPRVGSSASSCGASAARTS